MVNKRKTTIANISNGELFDDPVETTD